MADLDLMQFHRTRAQFPLLRGEGLELVQNELAPLIEYDMSHTPSKE